MIKEHPVLFFFSCFALAALSVAHVAVADEFASKNKRGGFERLCLGLGMLVLWPVFSFGMMCSGYSHFWHKTWGDKPSWERDGKV